MKLEASKDLLRLGVGALLLLVPARGVGQPHKGSTPALCNSEKSGKRERKGFYIYIYIYTYDR